MKNRIIAIVLITLILFGGYVVSDYHNKKKSNQEEIVNEIVEEVEEPKEEVVPEQKLEQKKTTKKKTTTTKKKTTSTKKTSTTKVAYNVGELQNYAHNLVISYGWSEYDYECLIKLWNRESGWNPNAVNKKSGACGVPQSLPCNKMASEGSDYRTNGKTQIRWGLKYIKNRYGSPSNAWAHSQKKGWY